jgi:hypothetical protein
MALIRVYFGYVASVVFIAWVCLLQESRANRFSEVPTNSNIYALRKKLNWCGQHHEVGALVGLDDLLCQKQFPKTFDREFQCPTFARSVFSKNQTFYSASTNVSDIIIDEIELDNIVSKDFSIATGIVQRDTNGSNNYKVRYIGTNAKAAHETWSSSKIFAGHNAGNKINLSMFQSSLYTNVTLSDLMTIVTSYDTTKHLSSNGIGAYYHAIGGHQHADDFIHNVLGVSRLSGESFGGNYGEAVPTPPLEYTFTNTLETNNPRKHQIIENIDPDPTPSPPLSNTMSSITMAEWLRRIIFAREDRGNVGNQYFNWENSKDILYGASNSSYFPSLQYGGMSMSSDVYLQLGVGNELLNKTRHDSDWRIFSKLGFGYTSIRKQYEVTLNGYMCLPLGNDGNGVEFVLSAKTFDKTLDNGKKVDLKMREGIKNITQYIISKYGIV